MNSYGAAPGGGRPCFTCELLFSQHPTPPNRPKYVLIIIIFLPSKLPTNQPFMFYGWPRHDWLEYLWASILYFNLERAPRATIPRHSHNQIQHCRATTWRVESVFEICHPFRCYILPLTGLFESWTFANTTFRRANHSLRMFIAQMQHPSQNFGL